MLNSLDLLIRATYCLSVAGCIIAICVAEKRMQAEKDDPLLGRLLVGAAIFAVIPIFNTLVTIACMHVLLKGRPRPRGDAGHQDVKKQATDDSFKLRRAHLDRVQMDVAQRQREAMQRRD